MNVDKILAARQETHGDFKDHASATQRLKLILRSSAGMVGFDGLCAEHKEALDMIVHKIGRILAGDPFYKDHWDDICGYAKLGGNVCEQKK